MSAGRASDAEREQAAERLRAAATEGRLTVEELAQRAELVYAATTRGELEQATADLPAPAPPAAPAQHHRALLSSTEHAGRRRLPLKSRYVSILGSTRLDLRDAVLPGPEAEIELRAVLGSAEVTVPEGVAVEVTGGGLMLSHEIRVADAVAAPGAPTIRIRIGGALSSVKISDRPSLGAQIRERVRRSLEP